MEQGPDRDEDEAGSDDDPSRPDPGGPPTGGVRIIGAETAAEITSEVPVVPPASIGKDPVSRPAVRIIDDPDGAASTEPADGATHAELPHWTEPATGQVPAVLARDDAPTDGILPPTWREEDADWVAHEEEFEPSMFSDDRASLGALDETDDTDVERRPWEFDLDSVRAGQPGPLSAPAGDPITEPVPVVGAGRGPVDEPRPELGAPELRPTGEPTVAVSAAEIAALSDSGPSRNDDPAGASAGGGAESVVGTADAAGTDLPTPGDDRDGEDDVARPAGTVRSGRARRGGLMPDRLKAKRPEEVEGIVAEPLAAEPPGASVTDVPGAGRRRAGLASLAAADRIAEQEQEAAPSTAAADTGAAVLATEPVRRRRRAEPRDGDAGRPLRASSNYTPEVTGGHPPSPDESDRSSAQAGDRTGGGSTGLRVGTGVAVAIVALAAFKLGTVPSAVLCVLVVTFAAGEAFAVLRRAGWRPATLLGLVGTISLSVGAYNKGVAALPLVLVLVAVFTLLWYLFGVERGSAVAGTAGTLLVIGWVSLLGSYSCLLLAPSDFPDRHGIAFLLGAIIATAANDIGALVVGRWIGTHQLAPNVSPNKTWEGLAGGALASILVSTIVVGAIHPWTASNAALLGVVVAVVAPLGDLCESLLKRDLRLKDMGTLLPGHGGVLDRVDALIFVLPATYYLVRALHIA